MPSLAACVVLLYFIRVVGATFYAVAPHPAVQGTIYRVHKHDFRLLDKLLTVSAVKSLFWYALVKVQRDGLTGLLREC